MKVTANGQISLPAEVRKRWKAELGDRDAPLVTSDPVLLGLVPEENGRYTAPPDSTGEVWAPTPRR